MSLFRRQVAQAYGVSKWGVFPHLIVRYMDGVYCFSMFTVFWCLLLCCGQDKAERGRALRIVIKKWVRYENLNIYVFTVIVAETMALGSFGWG